MQFRKDIVAMIVLASASLLLAANAEPNSIPSLSDAASASFPCVAEVTGTDIYLRSGPGMNFYRCGKLSIPEKITVIEQKDGWSKVTPPAGSFSWISKDYVKFDSEHPETGIITADDTRVWAGSEYVEPMHSTSLQVKLNKGAKVNLLGEEKGDYYKIAPPAGAYLWINTQYIRIVGAGSLSPETISFADANAVADVNAVADANVVDVNDPNAIKPAKPKLTVEQIKLKEYRELSKQIDVEKAKPFEEQNWTSIQQGLTEIADNNEAGRAAKYSKAQLDRIEAIILAQEAGKALKEQNQQLAAAKEKIERKRQEELAKVPAVGKYVVVGTIRPSLLYSADSQNKRYVIMDNSGKIIAYAVAAPAAQGQDITAMIGKKVGLVGSIDRDSQSGSSLVTFTAVEPIP